MTKQIRFFAIAAFAIFLSACSKGPGPGGTSTITGQVYKANHEGARAEVTQIIVTTGALLEHGDYWVLNTAIPDVQFYIWYKNPTWVTDGDPGLDGRTGIPVTFNYSDSNTEIAFNTENAINDIAGAYVTVERTNDILVITCNGEGECPDAEKMSTHFNFDVMTQGRDETITQQVPATDERVYLIYGDDAIFSEDSHTGEDGQYQFTGLSKGDYTVYVISKDITTTDGTKSIKSQVTISKNRSVTTANQIDIYY